MFEMLSAVLLFPLFIFLYCFHHVLRNWKLTPIERHRTAVLFRLLTNRTFFRHIPHLYNLLTASWRQIKERLRFLSENSILFPERSFSIHFPVSFRFSSSQRASSLFNTFLKVYATSLLMRNIFSLSSAAYWKLCDHEYYSSQKV